MKLTKEQAKAAKQIEYKSEPCIIEIPAFLVDLLQLPIIRGTFVVNKEIEGDV